MCFSRVKTRSAATNFKSSRKQVHVNPQNNRGTASLMKPVNEKQTGYQNKMNQRVQQRKQTIEYWSNLTKKGETIKKDCLSQNNKFQKWSRERSWRTFHSSHYDWWAFPIDRPSGSYGSAYKVQIQDLHVLSRDTQFIQALSQNAILVCRSWGWNLEDGEMIKKTDEDQKWQRWPIRLSKMCRSLQIFKQESKIISNLFKNAIKYAMIILNQYKKLTYGGNDLSNYFREKDQQLKGVEQQRSRKKDSKTGGQQQQDRKGNIKQEQERVQKWGQYDRFNQLVLKHNKG